MASMGQAAPGEILAFLRKNAYTETVSVQSVILLYLVTRESKGINCVSYNQAIPWPLFKLTETPSPVNISFFISKPLGQLKPYFM